jgi:hypothetical protein
MIFRTSLLAVSLSFAGAAFAHDGAEPVTTVHVASAPEKKAWTGEGDYRFESDPGWGSIPFNELPIPTHGGVAKDKAGFTYVSTDSAKGILVFDKEGIYRRSIASEHKAIHSLMIREEKGEEILYGAWLGGKHGLKMKLDGTVLLKIPCPMESGKYTDANQWAPTAIDSAPDGSIFIADGYGLSYVHKFDSTGKYLLSFGGKGSGDDQFQTCHGLAVDLRGDKPLLLICDRENKRLQHFDLDGKYVANVAKDLRRPCAVSFEGKMVAIAELAGRVTILDENNKEVAHLGENTNDKQRAQFGVPATDWKPLLFTSPHGISWDGNGGVIVQDWNATGRVRHLRRLK